MMAHLRIHPITSQHLRRCDFVSLGRLHQRKTLASAQSNRSFRGGWIHALSLLCDFDEIASYQSPCRLASGFHVGLPTVGKNDTRRLTGTDRGITCALAQEIDDANL